MRPTELRGRSDGYERPAADVETKIDGRRPARSRLQVSQPASVNCDESS